MVHDPCMGLKCLNSPLQVTTCLRQAPGSNRVYMKGVAFKEGPIRVVVETRDDFQQEMTGVLPPLSPLKSLEELLKDPCGL